MLMAGLSEFYINFFSKKTMKTSITHLSKLSLFAAVLGFTTLFSSCSDDDDVDTGRSVNVKVVNASEGAGAQDFFIEGAKVTSVAEGEASNYVTVTQSGDDRDVQFRKSGSAEVYASKELDLKENRNYTFFLTGTGNSAAVRTTEDDLTAPNSGKAKVRFLHLSSAAPENVDIYTGINTKIAAGIKRNDEVSSFIQIDPAAGIGVLPAGSSGAGVINTIALGPIQAGKIYTILIYGSTDINARAVAHN